MKGASSFARRVFVERSTGKFVEFFRYALVSGLSLAVDFGGLYLLTKYAGIYYLISAIISYSGGMVVNYVLSIFWVFPKSRLRSRTAEFVIFVAIGVAGMGVNELLLWLLTGVLHLYLMLSRAFSAVIGYIWKYALRKVILFS